MKQILLTASIAICTLNSTNAQQYQQNARIRQGVHSGQITAKEGMAIARQQKDVRIAQQVAKSDGVITPQERHIIHRENAQLNHTIYRTKHNKHKR